MKLVPQPEALRQGRFGWPDFLLILAVLTLVARVGTEAMVRFHPPDVTPGVSLDPCHLPDVELPLLSGGPWPRMSAGEWSGPGHEPAPS
ncbi:MAG: hypothetical protein ACK587_11290 [Cyanobacteriota bacterium]